MRKNNNSYLQDDPETTTTIFFVFFFALSLSLSPLLSRDPRIRLWRDFSRFARSSSSFPCFLTNFAGNCRLRRHSRCFSLLYRYSAVRFVFPVPLTTPGFYWKRRSSSHSISLSSVSMTIPRSRCQVFLILERRYEFQETKAHFFRARKSTKKKYTHTHTHARAFNFNEYIPLIFSSSFDAPAFYKLVKLLKVEKK